MAAQLSRCRLPSYLSSVRSILCCTLLSPPPRQVNLVTSPVSGDRPSSPSPAAPGRAVTESRSAGSSCGGGGGEESTSAPAPPPARQSHSLVTMETLTDELVANIMGEVCERMWAVVSELCNSLIPRHNLYGSRFISVSESNKVNVMNIRMLMRDREGVLILKRKRL